MQAADYFAGGWAENGLGIILQGSGHTFCPAAKSECFH